MNENLNDQLYDERKNRIEAFLNSREYQPMKRHELSFVLEVPVAEAPLLDQIIDELIQNGKVIETKKGKLMASAKLNMVSGTFLSNAKGFGFIRTEEGDSDIFIPANSVNGAFHKDQVLVQVVKKENKTARAEGEVVRVLKRGLSAIVGVYEQVQGFGFVVPDDNKIAQDIFIAQGKSLGAVTGHKVVVKITKMAENRRNPEGQVTEILGHVNDPGVDILSITRQYDVPEAFPEKVLESLDMIPADVTEADRQGREDLRGWRMVTIDGDDSKDLDDAVSLEKTPDGTYQLGVHIADVSHYVVENSSLDKEALARGCSIYLADRVIPMLPPFLSNGICSLNPNVDRLALSCVMEIDGKGIVLNHRVFESVIHVDRRMTYTNVKKILEDQDEGLRKEYTDFLPMFEMMEELCQVLRNKRKQRGALDFDLPESKMLMDANGKPVDILPYERNIATKIIEEFMLVCNETIAEDYYWRQVPFVYRTHGKPDPEKVLYLAEFIRNFGYVLKGAAQEMHPKAYQKILEEIEGKKEEQIISRIVLRSMRQARYSDSNDGHFGLSAKYYCHFTSPIRRYPDLQIHRIIKESLKTPIEGKREAYLSKRAEQVAKESSVRERLADEVEREVEKMKKVEFMEDKIGQVFEGVISSVTNWGLFVELYNTVEGLIPIASLEDDYYIYNEKHMTLTGEHTKKIYRLGDQVTVAVVRADKQQRTIDFALAEED